MSIIAIGMNLMLAGLLVAALLMGMRLNGRLKALRDSHAGFAKAVAELDAAALRAEQGLADLRSATDEAIDTLADRIEKARALSAKLDRQLLSAPRHSSPEREAPRELLREVARGRERAFERFDRESDDTFGADVERVTHRLGSLLSQARDARPVRPEPERAARRDAPSRQRPSFEDDLFEAPEDRAPLRAGARR